MRLTGTFCIWGIMTHELLVIIKHLKTQFSETLRFTYKSSTLAFQNITCLIVFGQ